MACTYNGLYLGSGDDPGKPQLEYYGGNGVESVFNDKGKFEVNFGGDKKIIRVFVSLKEAKRFYDSLNEPKALWDMTRIPELLECHTLAHDTSTH